MGRIGRPRSQVPEGERLLRHIEIDMTRQCWLWSGARMKCGYGRIHVGSLFDGTNRVELAHRVSYRAFVGPIPDDMLVMHKCDVRECINPEHLSLGTYRDNTQDMLRKGRGNHSRGERHRSAKLTEGQVREIRNSSETLRVLAQKYGIASPVVHAVRSRRTWRHVV